MLSSDRDVQAMIVNYQINPRLQKFNLFQRCFKSLQTSISEKLNLAKFNAPKLSSRRLTSAIVIFGLTLGSSAALAPVAQASRTFVSESATYDTAATIEFAVPVFNDGDF